MLCKTIGTRGSQLALSQTGLVAATLQARHPQLSLTTTVIHTQGDRDQHSSLREIGGQGAFVKELEAALLRGDIDLAVHSLKDLPATLPLGLSLQPVLAREDPRDALLTRDRTPLAALLPGARVGTGSARRAVQLRQLRPDLSILDIRGNVDTRLRKLDQGEYDAVVLAAAGLKRLGLADRVTEYFSVDTMLPSPGQGILAVELRASDEALAEWVNAIVDPATETVALAERAFLARLGAGCRLPVAAYAMVETERDSVTLRVMLGREAEANPVRAEATAPVAYAVALGQALAEQLLAEVGEAYAV